MRTVKFKSSEVGLIPEEWDVKSLGDIGEPLMCKRILKSQTCDSGDVPFYKIGTFGRSADAYISRELFNSFRRQYSYPRAGDVLISAAGTIGRTVVFDGEDAYFQDSNIVWIGHDETIVLNSYLRWYLDVIKWQTEDGGTVTRLYNSNLRGSLMVVPPRPEQERIAEALSDVEALLSAMTTLIEKKRAIKQGAMQQLLTGKKRLAGFTGPWVKKRICDIGQVVTGATPPRNSDSNWTGNFPWISAKDFKGKYIWDSEEHISDSGRMFCRILPANSVLVTCIASIGLNAISKVSCATNQQINAVVCKTWDTEFFYYQICRMCEDLKQIAGQTAVPIIGKSQFEQMSISGPSDFAEQKAIAEVLSDMDAEIAALESKRAKYESIKQGMMQELLTGKVRLV